MALITIVGLVTCLISVIFLPFLMEEAGREMRGEFHVRRHYRPVQSKPVKRSRPLSTPNVGMHVNRIQGEICWRTGQRRHDCNCGSCRK
jgi:hypothetical protein